MASKKAVLGRGLNALLPPRDDEPLEEQGGLEAPNTRLYEFEERVRMVGRVAEIPVEHIRPNPYQPRQEFNERALDELAASILQLGIIQPITVRSLGGGKYEIITGERRIRAARRAGLRNVPAYVRDADSEEMLEMALVENVQREELNPIEIAVGYQRLIDECELTQEKVAQKVGKNRATIANFLRLLKLPVRIQAGLRDGILSVGHARALIPIEDEETQLRVFREIDEHGLSVRDVEDRVRALRESPAAPRVTPPTETKSEPAIPSRESLELRQFTDRLRSSLGTQVAIKRKSAEGGRIEIQFYSDEDLERLVDVILGKESY